MTCFELRTSGARSDCSTNWATTTANFIELDTITMLFKEIYIISKNYNSILVTTKSFIILADFVVVEIRE